MPATSPITAIIHCPFLPAYHDNFLPDYREAEHEFQKELKERHFHLPVIAISARDDAETSMLARQMGAQFFLRKPVDDQALIDAIHWVLDSNRSGQPMS